MELGAEAVTQPAQLATEQRRLSRWHVSGMVGPWHGRPLPAPGSSSPLSLQQSCLPLEPGVHCLWLPSTLGPWPPALCTHLPTEGALTPLPCAPTPHWPLLQVDSEPLSCHVDPRTCRAKFLQLRGENHGSKPECPALPRCRGKRVTTCCPRSLGKGRAFPLTCCFQD